ncbi:MAG: MBL fold metallo-hydrolase [Nanoarchaeota archaeon]|nr:MBL fold metallo-hydrolase [Nanoarchaeota archaeon]
MEIDGITLEWLGHAAYRIKADKTIYIDPFKLTTDEPADMILLTHEHFDHCSVEDIKKISTAETLIFAPPDCQSKLSDVKARGVTLVEPGKKIKVNNMMIETVAAYNTNKDFHPKENEWVGYMITVNGKRIYHAGDTDLIPEMKDIKADVALLPVSGTYVMTAEEAAQAANMIQPEISIPMHYGSIVGKEDDAQRFKQLVKGKVEILKKS